MTAGGLLAVSDLPRREFGSIVRRAVSIRRRGAGGMPLRGKTLAMIFNKPSTRTRASFEAGMAQLGGHALNLEPQSMQTSRGESAADTARTLSRYVDCIMARVYGHGEIEEMARHSSVPVINGLSNTHHPCQALADFATILDRKGRMDRLDIAWIGDGSNVCNSLIEACALAGSRIRVATPAGLEPDGRVVSAAGGSVELLRDPAEAAAGADVVATDTFSSMHSGSSRLKKLSPKYRVTEAIMSASAGDSIFLHCLPAKRGVEVDASVIDGPRSAVWDEAEYRLHAQKALLLYLLGRRERRRTPSRAADT